MGFLDKNYLLESKPAREIYQSIRDLPILDPHNHADIQEILDNDNWNDFWEIEGATDHYVWELMRKRGIPESKITGNADNYEKWKALAQVFPELAGNPTYEWIHLDLKRRFGINKLINIDNAEEIWQETKQKLSQPEMRPRQVLEEMNVKTLCTTDDPTMSLPYHKTMQAEDSEFTVLPTFRPDDLMKIGEDDWNSKVDQLGEETDLQIKTAKDLISALKKVYDYFDSLGCVASDHGIERPFAYHVEEKTCESIFTKGRNNESLTQKEKNDFQAFLLHKFAELNAEKNWVMQLHIGAVRDYRNKLYEQLGADSGGDLSTQDIEYLDNLKDLLNTFDEELEIVLYCLDPTHLPTITTIARAFPNVSIGAAWWFNDSNFGMEQHLEYFGSVDLLSNFAGMVTDSRKIMSFQSRTEMFRRSLSNVVGKMVKKGQVPGKVAHELARRVAYERPKELFFE